MRETLVAEAQADVIVTIMLGSGVDSDNARCWEYRVPPAVGSLRTWAGE
jgi:hypothetical protein